MSRSVILISSDSSDEDEVSDPESNRAESPKGHWCRVRRAAALAGLLLLLAAVAVGAALTFAPHGVAFRSRSVHASQLNERDNDIFQKEKTLLDASASSMMARMAVVVENVTLTEIANATDTANKPKIANAMAAAKTMEIANATEAANTMEMTNATAAANRTSAANATGTTNRTETANAGDGDLTIGSASGDIETQYWDGQCTPCPAQYYGHCSQGGKLVGDRHCFREGSMAYCEGLCRRPSGAPPAPAPVGPVPGTVGRSIMTLYHHTSPEVARLILRNGFRPGTEGWCGGAIYFIDTPILKGSKHGPVTKLGAVIRAQVDMGRMAHLNSTCSGAHRAWADFDSITFDPGDGPEFIIHSNNRVVSASLYTP